MDHNLLHSDYSLRLIKIMSKESGLQALVDLGYEMLGNPFTITDFSVKLLAYTGETIVTDDPVWNELMLSKNFNFKTYSYYVKNKLFEQITNNEGPFYWMDPYCKYPRIISKICINRRNVAFLAVCAHERDFKESDKEIVSILCDAFSIELQKNKYRNYPQVLLHQSFLYDLIDGKFEDEKVIDERMKVLTLKLKKRLFLISMDIVNLDTSNSALPFMRDEVENKFANAKVVIYDHNIVILASCENEMHFLEVETKSFKDFIDNNNLKAGISRSFSNLAEVREHYLESVEALKLGNILKKDSHFFCYETYLIFDFININADNKKIQKFIHPSLIKLIEYDKKSRTEYARSFYSYLLNFKNVKDTSDSLNIHRNTMFHRLEKIEEILNVDLNNGDILFKLYLSYKILEFLKIDLP